MRTTPRVAGFRSEYLAGFELECMAGFVGIRSEGNKHPLAVVKGATENTAAVQLLLDNLTGRGLDPTVCRLSIVDSAKALSKEIRQTFGRHTPIRRCQIHNASNIVKRL